MFVKICGVTRPVDAVAAASAGADAIGLNFVPTSSRYVDLDIARTILDVVPEHVTAVGVFRNHAATEVLEIAGSLGLAAAQLHGDETPDVTAAVAEHVTTVIKVFAAGSPAIASIGEHPADVVMIDAAEPGRGVTFDWDLVGDLGANHRLLLAGGLRPDNVGDAIRRVGPWGVDVASGVEAEPRRKDPDAMSRFVAEARNAGGGSTNR